MRSLTAGIAIMNLRMLLKLTPLIGMMFPDIKWKGSYVLFATQNKMFNKIVKVVEFAWGIISARYANSLMMTFRRNNFIVMNVEYVGETICLQLPYTWLIQARKIVKIYQMIHAELVARRTFFTATNVGVAIQIWSKVPIIVWKEQCIIIVQFVLSFYLTQWRTLLFYYVDIRYIWSVSRKWSFTIDIHVLSAQNPSVTCPTYGERSTKRLLQLLCQKCTRTKWCGYCAMTVNRHARYSTTLWHTNACDAALTILDKFKESCRLEGGLWLFNNGIQRQWCAQSEDGE